VQHSKQKTGDGLKGKTSFQKSKRRGELNVKPEGVGAFKTVRPTEKRGKRGGGGSKNREILKSLGGSPAGNERKPITSV